MSRSLAVTEPDASCADRARRRIAFRLMPFLFVLYIIAFIDRVNVSYAALEMKTDLGFSDSVLGYGTGIFFVGYFLLQIPGTLLVERWSARRWIAAMMIAWGILATATGFIRTSGQFHWLRLLLGAAQAGFFPGVIVYLSHWYRYEDRAKAVALFMSAIPVSNVIGSPISGLILGIGWLGMPGWRWVFILEGIPAVILGAWALYYLTDRPRDASWLAEDERRWISGELEHENRAKQAARPLTILQAFRHPEVLTLVAAYFMMVTGYYGFTLWLPTILKRLSGLSNLTVTVVAMVPFAAALAGMLFVGWRSDRTGERRWHTAVPALIGAAALAAGVAVTDNVALSVALFAVVAAGGLSYLPAFWAIPTAFLTESAAAASIGLINSFGNLGGFVGPYLVGYLRDATGSFAAGMLSLALSMAAGGLLVLTLRPHPPIRR